MFPQIFGKYVLEREIAGGGMARVYLATLRGAVGFEKRLVVKQIRPELASDDAFVRRFVEEAKTAVELNHPNIVPVYELGVEQGIFYLAMELCEGATLFEILSETGPLTAGEGAYVGIEICRALDYAHRRSGIVHRDVTPRNVMLDDEGAVRLIDFGIAAPVTLPDSEGSERTELFGSPGHMPPEQIGGRSLTPATDVFAVGALLIEAWTGKPPFRRATPAACLKALETPPPPIDEDRPELADVAELMASAVALAPEARPASAELLARPLRDFVKSVDLGDVARRLGERVRRTRRRMMASAPWLAADGGTGSPSPPAAEGREREASRASFGDTQTFAIRDDLVEWTRKLPSAPPPEPSAEDVLETPAMSTRPLDAVTRPAATAAERPSTADEPAPTTANGRGPSSAQRSWASGWGGLTVLLAVAAVIWGGSRWLGAPKPEPAPTAASSTLPQAPATSASQPSAPSLPSSAPSASAPGLPTAPVGSSRLSGSGSGPATAAVDAAAPDRAGRATLRLTATPPAAVSIGSRSYGTTPTTVEVAVGTHIVTFRSAVLDDRVSTQITLAAGETRTVHADFEGAKPRVFPR